MTEPLTPDEEVLAETMASERNYASDRHLLLREIQVLSKEVARLRGDTKHLNDIVIPREEHARRRKVNTVLAGFSFLLFFIAMTGVYVIGSRLQQTNDNFAKSAYESCLARNASAAQGAKGVVEINALLATLRDTEAALAKIDPPAGSAARQQRVDAFDRYLDFVAKSAAAPVGPKSPDCQTFLR